MLGSRGGAECVSDAVQDRWSLGELHRSLANPLLAWWKRRGGGGSRTLTAVKTSPHPTTSPNPAGKKNVSNKTALSAFQCRRPGSRGRRRWFRSLALAGRIGSGVFSLSVCVSHSLSLLFRSVNVRSRSLVSGNDLTQQTESSGRAEPRKEKRRGGATSPPPGSTRASASPFATFP